MISMRGWVAEKHLARQHMLSGGRAHTAAALHAQGRRWPNSRASPLVVGLNALLVKHRRVLGA